MISQHYDDAAIVALLDAPGAESDVHLIECLDCRRSFDEYRAVTSCLGQEAVWDLRVLKEEPAPQTIRNIRAFADRMRDEDTAALPLVAELLAGPREEWMPRLQADPKYRTAGVVRKLMEASDKAIDVMPPDALEISALATEIADNLDPADYPSDTVMKLRGNAWREATFASFYSGDLHRAVRSLAAAYTCFESSPISEFEIARSRLIESMIYRGFDDLGNAARLAAETMPTFVKAGERRRWKIARTLEGAIAFRAGDYGRALAIWTSLSKVAQDDVERIAFLQNVALCKRELGDIESALDCYKNALEVARRSNAPLTTLLRLRWNVGKMLTVQQRYQESLVTLRNVQQEFARLEMREEAVLAALDTAEVLVIQHEHVSATEICRNVIEELRAANLEHTSRALTAVSYLTELMVARAATPQLVGHVRDFVDRVRRQPTLLFAPLPVEPS